MSVVVEAPRFFDKEIPDTFFRGRFARLEDEVRANFKVDIDVEQRVGQLLGEIDRFLEGNWISQAEANALKQKVYKHALRNQISKTVRIFQEFQTHIGIFHSQLSDLLDELPRSRTEILTILTDPQLLVKEGRKYLNLKAGKEEDLDLAIDLIEKIAFQNFGIELGQGSFKGRILRISAAVQDQKAKRALLRLSEEGKKIDGLLEEENRTIHDGVAVIDAARTFKELKRKTIDRRYAISKQLSKLLGNPSSKNQRVVTQIFNELKELDSAADRLRSAYQVLKRLPGRFSWGIDAELESFFGNLSWDLDSCKNFLIRCAEERGIEAQFPQEEPFSLHRGPISEEIVPPSIDREAEHQKAVEAAVERHLQRKAEKANGAVPLANNAPVEPLQETVLPSVYDRWEQNRAAREAAQPKSRWERFCDFFTWLFRSCLRFF